MSTLGNNKGNLEFSVILPNNDTLKIDLSFQLMKISTSLDVPQADTATELRTTSSTTTTTSKPVDKYFTVEETIEAFRQNLIRKETDIAGIIESDNKFYRHFRLEYDNVYLTIRCTYDSNYKNRTLNIKCYEYREYETERIMSNGEIELFTAQDTTYRSDVELINIQNYMQTYNMTIS